MVRDDSHVLVIEDDQDIRDLVVATLRRFGHRTTAAATGDLGWERLQAGGHDLAIIDWMLPGPTGIDLVRMTRAHERVRGLPILMLTARAMPQDIKAGLEAGANAYLTKPFSAQALGDVVAELLGREPGPMLRSVAGPRPE